MAHRDPPDSGTASLVESYPLPPGRTTLDAIAVIPEEHVWLASRKSPRTRRACGQDVARPRINRREGSTPAFRPLRHNGKQRLPRRHLDPDAIDRIVKKYTRPLLQALPYSCSNR